jgi:hypothetical protein
MVDAAYGRIGVYMLQEDCRRLGIGPSETAINDLANAFIALPQNHPMARPLGEAARQFDQVVVDTSKAAQRNLAV